MANNVATLILPFTTNEDLPLIQGDIIAVDGGSAFALQHQLKISLAIGDFDSLSKTFYQRLIDLQIPISTYPSEKDASDIELALAWALTKPYQTIYVVGFSGGRLDHYQAMLQTLFRLKKDFIYFVSPTQWIQYVGVKSHVLRPQKGEHYFSIFTFAHAEVSLLNCRYPLDHQTLTVSDTFTLSNEWIEGKPTTLLVHAGGVLLFRSFRQGKRAITGDRP